MKVRQKPDAYNKNLQTQNTFCDFLEFSTVTDRNFWTATQKFNCPLIRGYSWHKNQNKKDTRELL